MAMVFHQQQKQQQQRRNVSNTSSGGKTSSNTSNNGSNKLDADTSASAPNLTTSTTATANNSGQNVAQKIRFFSIQRTASYKDTPSSRLSNIQVKAYKPPGERASSGGASGRRGNNKNKANNARPSEPKKSKLWYETYACGDMTREDIKRQESIHELCQGETEMLSDLTLAKQTYRDAMLTLSLLSEEESETIFSKLDMLLPLHRDLVARIEGVRGHDGKIHRIGHVLVDWLPTLSLYKEYLLNQSSAKQLLDEVTKRKKVQDFLQRCIKSPFSRKLEVWNYISVPRSRMFKYPLLLKNILKSTPDKHEDVEDLQKALKIIQDIIANINTCLGESNFREAMEKLEFQSDKQRQMKAVNESTVMLCSGQLKSGKGTKLEGYLFDRVLIFGRQTTTSTRHDHIHKQPVYREPLPVEGLVLQTAEDGTKASTSMKPHAFKVYSETYGTTTVLVASDEHDRKMWVTQIQAVIQQFQQQQQQLKQQQQNIRRSCSSVSVAEAVAVAATTSADGDGSASGGGHNGVKQRQRSKTFGPSSPLTSSARSPVAATGVCKPAAAAAVTSNEQQQQHHKRDLPRRSGSSGSNSSSSSSSIVNSFQRHFWRSSKTSSSSSSSSSHHHSSNSHAATSDQQHVSTPPPSAMVTSSSSAFAENEQLRKQQEQRRSRSLTSSPNLHRKTQGDVVGGGDDFTCTTDPAKLSRSMSCKSKTAIPSGSGGGFLKRFVPRRNVSFRSNKSSVTSVSTLSRDPSFNSDSSSAKSIKEEELQDDCDVTSPAAAAVDDVRPDRPSAIKRFIGAKRCEDLDVTPWTVPDDDDATAATTAAVTAATTPMVGKMELVGEQDQVTAAAAAVIVPMKEASAVAAALMKKSSDVPTEAVVSPMKEATGVAVAAMKEASVVAAVPMEEAAVTIKEVGDAATNTLAEEAAAPMEEESSTPMEEANTSMEEVNNEVATCPGGSEVDDMAVTEANAVVEKLHDVTDAEIADVVAGLLEASLASLEEREEEEEVATGAAASVVCLEQNTSVLSLDDGANVTCDAAAAAAVAAASSSSFEPEVIEVPNFFCGKIHGDDGDDDEHSDEDEDVTSLL